MALNVVDDRTKLTLRNQVELLCFRVSNDGTPFAINVFKVREAVKYRSLTELPETDEAICGLLTLRKEIIPIVDLRAWLYRGRNTFPTFGVMSEEEKKETQIIVCEFNNITIGIWVHKAEYILRRNWEDIHVPVSSEFGSKTNNYTKNDDGNIVYIVDVEGMLSELFPMVAEQKNSETASLTKMDLLDKMVLIAEDSRSALKALVAVLDKLGVRYLAFDNGKKLLKYINERNDLSDIGMIITDLEMPEASGFTVIKELKGDPKTDKIPIVVNSSMTGTSNQEMAKSLNAEGFIGKTNPKEISEYVKEFLERK